MGTFDSVYKNKIRQLEEENRQLRKILREAESGQYYPPNPIIPTPEQSGPLDPARGYQDKPTQWHPPLDVPWWERRPGGKPTGWHPPLDSPWWAKPQYGPWELRPDGTEYPWSPIIDPNIYPPKPQRNPRPFGPNDLYR